MTSPAETASGFALCCDETGRVHRIIRDDLQLTEALARTGGRGLQRILPPEHGPRLDAFLREVGARGAVFGWEATLPCGPAGGTWYLTGVRSGDQIVVVGSREGPELVRLVEDFARITNEQANALRATTKELSGRERRAGPQGDVSIQATPPKRASSAT